MNDMPTMQLIKTTAEGWGLQLYVPELLRPSCFERPARQAFSHGDARSNPQIRRATWTGRDLGARKPDADETPLSISECWHGLTRGIL